VPVIGEVKPVLQATPDQIHIGSSSTGAVERMVRLRSGDGRAFEIFSATLEHADGKVETKKLADGKWQIKFTVQPDSIPSGAMLRVATSCTQQPAIKIPLSFRH
jgi:hypothetical protein